MSVAPGSTGMLMNLSSSSFAAAAPLIGSARSMNVSVSSDRGAIGTAADIVFVQ